MMCLSYGGSRPDSGRNSDCLSGWKINHHFTIQAPRVSQFRDCGDVIDAAHISCCQLSCAEFIPLSLAKMAESGVFLSLANADFRGSVVLTSPDSATLTSSGAVFFLNIENCRFGLYITDWQCYWFGRDFSIVEKIIAF
jgi:hypothetical protein